MARLHYTLVKVALGADIDADDTSITLAAPLKEFGEDNIATVTAPDVLVLRCAYEVLHVTAYTAGATTATVLRGQEGSTATAHNEGDILRHVLTAEDFDEFGAGALDDLTDVDTSTTPPTDGQALVFDTGSSLWVPGTVAGGGSGDVATDPIWDAAGDLVYGTGADTAARLALGAALRVLRVNAGATAPEWADLSTIYQGINAGTLLAVTAYEPGSAQNKSTTSTTSTNGGSDIDATNLAVSFTAPPSGKVMITLEGRCSVAAVNNNVFWTLREGTSQVGKTAFVTDDNQSQRLTATFYVSGLTPGASKTYKWGWFVAGSTGNLNIDCSGAATSGGAYMKVYAAP